MYLFTGNSDKTSFQVFFFCVHCHLGLPRLQAGLVFCVRLLVVRTVKNIPLLHPPKKAMLIGRIADIVRSGHGPGFVS